jgi:hypothetical protein
MGARFARNLSFGFKYLMRFVNSLERREKIVDRSLRLMLLNQFWRGGKYIIYKNIERKNHGQ